MPKPQSPAHLPSDPLKMHFALKERGSDFSKIARALSTETRPITGSIVRSVVYGISLKHHEIVMDEIKRVLQRPTLRMQHR